MRDRRALLQYFGSIKRMKEADIDTLLNVQGMTRPAAEAVYNALHPAIAE